MSAYFPPSAIEAARAEGEALLTSVDRAAPKPDPMAAHHVDVSTPLVGGLIRLRSASGGL